MVILNGFRPNPVYELAVRNALCLPVIAVLERPRDEVEMPFDFFDLDPVFHEPLIEGRRWTTRQSKVFQAALQKRAQAMLVQPWTEPFAAVFGRRIAGSILRFVFEQKKQELDRVGRELMIFEHNLDHDYEIRGNAPIAPEPGRRLALQPSEISSRLFFTNLALQGIVQSARLEDIEAEQHVCLRICEKLTKITQDIAAMAQRLHSSVLDVQSAIRSGSRRPPTRPQLRAQLAKIKNRITEARHDIEALQRGPEK